MKQYYFECAIIFMNVILRPSILYGGECYYNLTESQLRSIERIEEKYLRKILKTSKGCPLVQMYLESGQWPARFELQKIRCLFLKQILRQDENSQVYKFVQLQLSQPVRGDLVTTRREDSMVHMVKYLLPQIIKLMKKKKNVLNKDHDDSSPL